MIIYIILLCLYKSVYILVEKSLEQKIGVQKFRLIRFSLRDENILKPFFHSS